MADSGNCARTKGMWENGAVTFRLLSNNDNKKIYISTVLLSCFVKCDLWKLLQY